MGFFLPQAYASHIIYAHSYSAILDLMYKYKITKFLVVPELLKVFMSKIKDEYSKKGFSKLFEKFKNLSLKANNHLMCIPESISNLQQLSILFVEKNINLKSLPSSLGNLRQLEYLYLNENSFEVDGVPLQLKQLTNTDIFGLSSLQECKLGYPWV